VRASDQFEKVINLVKPHQSLSLGLVDGRNIWINNLENSISVAKKAVEKLGENRVIIAPSCQLLHSPVDLDIEDKLDAEIKSWLAFAKQKLDEIILIAKSASLDTSALSADDKTKIEKNKSVILAKKVSAKIHNDAVKSRVASICENDKKRKNSYHIRKEIQNSYIPLPLLPTTTIGSFPQTEEVRKTRSDFKSGKISTENYEKFIKEEIARVVDFQEQIGIDVLVHGESERNDMVEYFGEQLNGFCFTKNGWVQSYGSRCVKPPVIFGDVSREKEMTIKWIKYAQELTAKPMKGMLTGPITILQWSFVRDDQPRRDTAMQIAFAIRDEVSDLEKAGIKIIQIDEAALREGLPLKKAKWNEYLKWAVDAFKIASSSVSDKTQIHTHMCYSEFNDIIEAIADMDADVISIETSRSHMKLLDAFVDFKYPNEIGPGVYDIHSPRVPSQKEIEDLLRKALSVLKPEQIWVNPDCGLKTRGWDETIGALKSMVEATKSVRASLK
jgi:5-methyltetrahydropteroyltriglutamate--homocysteine methyltransferase